MFETALRADAKRRIRQIGRADLVAGIPAYRNAKTIAALVQQVAMGLAAHYPDLRTVLVVADGGSTDDTVAAASAPPMPDSVKRIVTGYHGVTGRGSAVRAIFQIATALEADACIILDGDLKGMPPRWVRALADPVLSGDYEYLTPYYTYPRTESGPTDLIAYPLLRALLGRDVRQPTADVFGVSGELAGHFADKDVWETEVARAGVGVWMTAVAIQEGRRIGQAALGTRKHESREPSTTTDQAFSQMVGTLFRMAYIFRKTWLAFPEVQPVPVVGEAPLEPPMQGILTHEYLGERFRQASKRHRRLWQVALTPEHADEIRDVLNQPVEGFRFPDDLWARCVYDFIVVYNKGEADPDRVVESLIPLCCARQLAFLQETQGMSVEDTERVVARQAEAFIRQRPYFRERWEIYVPWAASPGAASARGS
ncbi:MAG: glycosyltransferase [Anaerolineales bacterium]